MYCRDDYSRHHPHVISWTAAANWRDALAGKIGESHDFSPWTRLSMLWLRCAKALSYIIIRVINFELVQPILPRYINVTDRWTDGDGRHMIAIYRALHYVHRAVKIGQYLLTIWTGICCIPVSRCMLAVYEGHAYSSFYRKRYCYSNTPFTYDEASSTSWLEELARASSSS